MRLYTFFRSSAAYRVRIALNLKGLEYEPVTIDLPANAHRREEFLRINPLATVPVLDDDGVVLTQSLAIIDYLDVRYPAPRLIPEEPVARAKALAFAQTIACEIHPLNNLRVLRYLRGELALDEAAVRRWYHHWIGESFAGLETLLRTTGGRYCVGDTLSIADVYLVPQVYNARRFECDMSPYPTLVAIADRLAIEPAFAAAAPDRQPDAQ
jgi:maleylacetoacetate isomerase